MRVIVDFCVMPVGVGVSVSKYVADCQREFSAAGLQTRLHALGTNIEGDWDAVFDAIKRCHELIHKEGAPRILTTLKITTRIDREQTIEEKIKSVETRI